MKLAGEKGITLVELLITLTIMGIIAMAAMPILSTCLEAHSQGTARSGLYQEGLLAMERMTSGVRRCTHLAIPNSWLTTRNILAISGTINEDNDNYFGDPLFPRIDEDVRGNINDDGGPGIMGIDDDGDGLTDEGVIPDDDESGSADEDWLDGVNNDADGNIDEDLTPDMNKDGASGIAGIDDDDDGLVDEGDRKNDDEDDAINEDNFNETLYTYNSGTHTLTESVPYTGASVVLSTHVNLFEAKYLAPGLIKIKLTLQGDDGEIVTFNENACSRNTFQKTGKRVR